MRPQSGGSRTAPTPECSVAALDGNPLAPAAGAAPLWLLDEPTLGLDAASVARLGGLLARHRAAGGAVVTATHLPLPLPDAAELRL